MRATRSDLTLPVAVVATVPVLLLRLSVSFLQMKVKRRGAVRTFRRKLVRGGMSPAFADRFAADYEALGRLRTYMPQGTRLRSFRP